MNIGIPSETRAHETRVAATPETVKKYVTQGHRVTIQSGAGTGASFPDEAFTATGAEIVDAATAFGADLVLKVQSPTDAELGVPVISLQITTIARSRLNKGYRSAPNI